MNGQIDTPSISSALGGLSTAQALSPWRRRRAGRGCNADSHFAHAGHATDRAVDPIRARLADACTAVVGIVVGTRVLVVTGIGRTIRHALHAERRDRGEANRLTLG